MKNARQSYRWKCQKCGLTYEKVTPGEPRGGCPLCRDKGAKSFEGVKNAKLNKQVRKGLEIVKLGAELHTGPGNCDECKGSSWCDNCVCQSVACDWIGRIIDKGGQK